MIPVPRARKPDRRQGFSLVELSIVVAIMAVVATLGLEVAANIVNRSGTSVSRERMAEVDAALVAFFKLYGRLPCPADRTLSSTSSSYGLANCVGAVQINVNLVAPGAPGNGLYAGAVPYRTLNLPAYDMLDGFNSELNYVVTANLTFAGGGTAAGTDYRFASSGFANTQQNGIGGIEVRTGVLDAACATNCEKLADPTAGTGAAYFLFSSGPDTRGAKSKLGTTLNPCAFAAADPRVDTQNCVFGVNATRTQMTVTTIGYNVFYDNRYNPGLNLTRYYDDVAIWRTKAQLW